PRKFIQSWFDILIATLRFLDETLMNQIEVIFQSTVMLASPSEYWISVINAGRKLKLDVILGDGANEDGISAGVVVSKLLHCGDLLALAPKNVVYYEEEQEVDLILFDKFLAGCSAEFAVFGKKIDVSAPIRVKKDKLLISSRLLS